MTERQWLRTTGRFDNLVEYLQEHHPSRRKDTLLGVALCRRIWHLLADERSRTGIEQVEALADPDTADPRMWLSLRAPGDAACDAPRNGNNCPAAAVVEHLVCNAEEHDPLPLDEIADGVLEAIWAETIGNHNPSSRELRDVVGAYPPKKRPRVLLREAAVQCRLLRDIFGNPFRPVAFDAAWRTSTAVSLAKHMYESRDFSAMPILADALQDAGCDNDDILNHCRSEDAVDGQGAKAPATPTFAAAGLSIWFSEKSDPPEELRP